MESAIHERPVRAPAPTHPPPRAFRPGSAMPEKAGAPGYGKVPPRIAAINDRKAVGGKISSRSKNMLDINFLIQREYTYKDEAAKRQAKRDAKA